MKIESVRFKNLALGYGNAPLLSGISLELPRGQAVRVKGETGCGKSAFLKLASGILTPLAGEYLLNDQPIQEMAFEEFLPYRLKIGYAFDLGGLLNNRTLRENLSLPMQYHKRYPPEEIQDRVEEILMQFDLLGVADRRPSAVAGSQRKACCVARSLAMRPEFLILDDPTTGLGPQASRALIAYLQGNLSRGVLRFLLLTTSDSNLVFALSPKDLNVKNQWLEWAA